MNGRRWHIALTARFGERSIGPDRRASAQSAALRSHVLLVFGDDSCSARYQIDAADMALALRSAMGKWAHVTETARLPWWEISHLEADVVPVDEDDEESRLDQIDEDDRVPGDVDPSFDSGDRRLRLVE